MRKKIKYVTVGFLAWCIFIYLGISFEQLNLNAFAWSHGMRANLIFGISIYLIISPAIYIFIDNVIEED